MNDTTTATDTELITGYLACWNTTDPTERHIAVEAVWAAGARSIDPLTDATGHAELEAMFAGFHEMYPGHSFRQVGGSDRHHQLLRWGWEMLTPDGTKVLDGLDVALLDDDGKIGYLAGFFGLPLPAAA